MVLELVESNLAAEITTALKRTATIGTSGPAPACDGQVLVINDMLGLEEGFKPKFLREYAKLTPLINDAVKRYIDDVKKASSPIKKNHININDKSGRY